jgi:hypothetical protein
MSDSAGYRIVSQGAEYELLCSEDQANYILRFKSEDQTANIQGDDAVRFKADYDTVIQQMPGSGPDQILAQLWDQGGYSWLAGAEAGGG